MRPCILVFPVLALAAAPVAVLSAPSGSIGPQLVVVPPWLQAVDVVRVAGGVPVGPGEAPLAVLAMPGDLDFGARVRAAGALALDAGVLFAFCGAD